jgi:hypothetical protein
MKPPTTALHVYTNDLVHVIAIDAADADRYVYVIDEDFWCESDDPPREWRQCGPGERLSIYCGEDGKPCRVDDGDPICRTMTEWIELCGPGFLCREE